MDFPRVAELVGGFLDSEGAPCALAGAWALHAWGHSRATQDLDLIVPREVQPRLIAFLEDAGYETLHRSAGYSNHLHPDPALGRLDFIYVDEETGDQLLGGCPRSLRLGSRELRVPRAEHLAALKAQAIKNDPQRRFQELADVRALLDVPGVDREEIRRAFERRGLEKSWRELEATL